MTAILEAQYGVRRTSGRLPDTEARLITSPRPRATMAGRNALQTRKTPRTLMSNTSSQASTSISVSGATGPAMPALLITIEISRSTSEAARASTEAGSATSQTRAVTRSSSPASASSGSARRPVMITEAPAPCRARVMAAPRPVPPPVTSAVRPVRGPVAGRAADGSRVGHQDLPASARLGASAASIQSCWSPSSFQARTSPERA